MDVASAMPSDRDEATQASNVCTVLALLSKPGSFAEKTPLASAKHCVAAAKICLKYRVKQLIIDAGEGPVGMIDSGDGTLIETRSRTIVGFAGGEVRRSGFGTKEY